MSFMKSYTVVIWFCSGHKRIAVEDEKIIATSRKFR